MYYLYKKTRGLELPEFNYDFRGFDEYYKIVDVLIVPLVGTYAIRIKSESFDDIVKFINSHDSSNSIINVYIEVHETLLNYLTLYKPDISMLDSISNYEAFKELVTRYSILFAEGCMSLLYNNIGHSYEEMHESLSLLKFEYPDRSTVINREIISKLFVINDIVYPRSILISSLFGYKVNNGRLNKCIDYFGNDMVMYSMAKTTRNLLKEKIEYYKTGQCSNYVKKIPIENLILMNNILNYSRNRFMDIKILLIMYERGINVNDFMEQRTFKGSN